MTARPGVPDLNASAVATLSAWRPQSPEQDALRRAYLDHLAAHPDGVWRDGPASHLTASCFVIDPAGESVLLTFHRKGRFWVQFGGHAERGDASLLDVARREAREESGIADIEPLGTPVDLDRHALPPGFGRCREHLDVVFLAVVPGTRVPSVSAESDDVAWWPIERLPPETVADLPPRLARVARRLRSMRQPVP